MKIQKFIKQEIEEQFDYADLLTVKEARTIPPRLASHTGWWWLQSPGIGPVLAADVNINGSVYSSGMNVDLSSDAVRPALRSKSGFVNLQIGDIIEFNNKKFEVIDNHTAFCLEDIGNRCFREDLTADNANVYEYSDVKKYIDNWFNGGKK